MAIIIIDPGHGGSKPGAVSGIITEKSITLDVAVKVSLNMVSLGHQVHLTRLGDDDVGLSAREQLVDVYGADCFLSIHCNATASHKAHGVETFYRDGLDSELAKCVQNSMAALTGLLDRGIFQDVARLEKHLTVLDNSPDVAACLVEIGFMDNPYDQAYILANPKTIAQAISEGICAFLKEGPK
jgi:N-acetylmuramoyl-L-alanine amidase